MKLSQKLIDKINEQINFEQASAYLYLSMVYELESRSLEGFGRWMRAQHHEELEHAAKMASYLLQRGVRPLQKAIPDVPNKWGTVPEIFEAALEHEKEVTKRIEAIVKLAIAEKDYNAEDFFREFVAEQVEEESNFNAIVDRLALSGGHGLLIMDHQLGKRQ